jgi:Zn-dependent protease
VLVEPERTTYDLHFRALGFPVRVHPWFWLGAVLLGANTLDLGIEFLAVWVAVVFVSILVHELGHAVAFRRFGSDASVILYAFGGLAVPANIVAGRGRRIIVSLAGPFAGFVLAGLVYGTNAATEWGEAANGTAPNGLLVNFLYSKLLWVNIIWGVFNLLPVYPLDGGQVSRELCGMKWGRRGKRISLKISFGTALAVVAYALFCTIDARTGAGLLKELPWWVPRGSIFTAILFGLLAYESYQLLQYRDWADDHWADDRTALDR